MSLSPRFRIAFFANALCVSAASLLFCASAAMAAASSATTTWRCGNAYVDRPCEGGRRVDTDDRRSTENQRAADAATLRIQRQADAMARDRERLESSAASRGNVTIIADPRIAERRERLALQAAQRKIDREDEARRQPRSPHDKRRKVKSKS